MTVMRRDAPDVLADRLAANRHRRERERYLATLPVSLRATLSAAPLVTPRQDDEIVRFCTAITAEGIGGLSPHPPGYRYKEFASRPPVVGALREFDPRRDHEPAVYRPNGKGPAFRVNFGWARERLPILFDVSPDGFVLTTESFTAGIVVTRCVGNLPHDPNPDEIL